MPTARDQVSERGLLKVRAEMDASGGLEHGEALRGILTLVLLIPPPLLGLPGALAAELEQGVDAIVALERMHQGDGEETQGFGKGRSGVRTHTAPPGARIGDQWRGQ